MKAASVCACPRALHLDAKEGYAPPAPGEEPLGVRGTYLNLIATPCLEGEAQRLGCSLIEGSWRSGEVKHYPDALAEQAQREGKPCVLVLDDAPFHTAGTIREREAQWEARGLRSYRLPSYYSARA